MRACSIMFALVLIAGCVAKQPEAKEDNSSFEGWWELSTVVDGRTIEVKRGGERMTVRLACIEVPPTGDFALASARELEHMIFSDVKILLDPKLDQRDSDGVLLVYVLVPRAYWTKDFWGNANSELVRRRQARYVTDGGESSLYHDEFSKAQHEADHYPKFYQTVGNSVVYKHVADWGSGDPTFSKLEVVSVKDGEATLRETRLSAAFEPMAGEKAEVVTWALATADGWHQAWFWTRIPATIEVAGREYSAEMFHLCEAGRTWKFEGVVIKRLSHDGVLTEGIKLNIAD